MSQATSLTTSTITHRDTLPVLLSIGEAAEVLRISKAQAYRWAKDGILPSIRLKGARSVRIPLKALDEWIARNTTKAS